MRKSFWNKRIPTLLVLFFLTISIGATSLLVNTNTRTIGKADEHLLPYNIQITNITDNSFTVTYVTSQVASGIILYGETAEGVYTAYDDRDKETGPLGLYNNHHITVKNVLPQTTYFFSIKSDSAEFLDESVPFTVTTAASLIKKPQRMENISGTVILNDYSKDNGIVFVKSNGFQTLSEVVQVDGSYSVPLEGIKNEDLSSYATIAQDTPFDLLFVNHREKSKVAIRAGNTPAIPPVVLSKNYDFTFIASPTPIPTEHSRFPAYQLGFDRSVSPQIVFPQNNQTINDDNPFIEGTASPSAEVKINIISQKKTEETVRADSAGMWQYKVKEPLPDGKYTLTITTKNNTGKIKIITHTFTIISPEINIHELLKNSLQTPEISSSSSVSKPLSNKNVLSASSIQIPLQFSTMIFITAIVITVIIGMLLFIISRQTSLL